MVIFCWGKGGGEDSKKCPSLPHVPLASEFSLLCNIILASASCLFIHVTKDFLYTVLPLVPYSLKIINKLWQRLCNDNLVRLFLKIELLHPASQRFSKTNLWSNRHVFAQSQWLFVLCLYKAIHSNWTPFWNLEKNTIIYPSCIKYHWICKLANSVKLDLNSFEKGKWEQDFIDIGQNKRFV